MRREDVVDNHRRKAVMCSGSHNQFSNSVKSNMGRCGIIGKLAELESDKMRETRNKK